MRPSLNMRGLRACHLTPASRVVLKERYGLFPKARNERIVNFANLSEKQAEICRKLNFQNLIVADFEFFAFEKFAGLGTRRKAVLKAQICDVNLHIISAIISLCFVRNREFSIFAKKVTKKYPRTPLLIP